MNPLDIALHVLKGHPSYDKRNLSDDAVRHKREYDTKYESTPERTKYRTDLKRERRQRGMMGHGGPDLSHTKRGGLVRENPHDNRARNQPGKSLKMLKFLPEQDPSSAFPHGSPEERGWWTTLQQLTAPDEEETEAPAVGVESRFPGMMVGDKWASTREEAAQMGGKFPPEDVIHRPKVEVMDRPVVPMKPPMKTETEASEAGGHRGVSYGDYSGMGEGYHRVKSPEYDVAGLNVLDLEGDKLMAHAKEFDKDGYAYMDKIGVPQHHQGSFGRRLHEHFKYMLARHARMAREHQTQEEMALPRGGQQQMEDELRILGKLQEMRDEVPPYD